MFEEKPEFEEKPILKVDVEGTNPVKWASFKDAFIGKIMKALDTVINPIDNTTLGEELNRITKNGLNFINAKLEKPGLDNQKLISDIELNLMAAAKTKAEARLINAKAVSVEFSNAIKQLKLAIGATNAFAIQSGDHDTILFCKNIQEVLNSLEASSINDQQLLPKDLE